MDYISQAEATIRALAPGSAPLTIIEPLQEDESRWFTQTLAAGLIEFKECASDCKRRKKHAVSGPDEFLGFEGGYRHLFSSPARPVAWLNREYIPHIAAYGRAVLDFGYETSRCAFSRYRRFTKDLITKKAGTDYETDVEFYDDEGELYLHIEAKRKPSEVTKIVKQIERAGTLKDLPEDTIKEIEYVLELRPRFLWLVGPGSVDPARHIFAVNVHDLNATFDRIEQMPRPPESYPR